MEKAHKALEKAQELWKRLIGKGTGILEKAHKALEKATKVHKALEKAQCVGSRNMISLLARNKTHQFCLEKCLAPASEILISHLKS